MKQLYHDLILQKCNLEKQTLRNALSIATQAPDEFAYNLMKGPGYMAVVAGEAVHVIKCIPVEVKIEHGSRCYAELQVTRKNMTFFLKPKTHILSHKGTEIICNVLLPSYYFVGDTWYKILPQPTEAVKPLVIKPRTKPTWKYVSPSHLATSGIYTEKDLKELRERIFFRIERPALLNGLAQEMNGQPVANNEGSLLKLLSEEAVSKIVESTWDKIWGRFMTFGTVSAGIIAILIILRTIKIFIDIFIRGYTLHTVFGWSIHLLGAIWSSVAHLLLYLNNRPNNPPTDIESQNTQPQNISTAPPEEKRQQNPAYFTYNVQ